MHDWMHLSTASKIAIPARTRLGRPLRRFARRNASSRTNTFLPSRLRDGHRAHIITQADPNWRPASVLRWTPPTAKSAAHPVCTGRAAPAERTESQAKTQKRNRGAGGRFAHNGSPFLLTPWRKKRKIRKKREFATVQSAEFEARQQPLWTAPVFGGIVRTHISTTSFGLIRNISHSPDLGRDGRAGPRDTVPCAGGGSGTDAGPSGHIHLSECACWSAEVSFARPLRGIEQK